MHVLGMCLLDIKLDLYAEGYNTYFNKGFSLKYVERKINAMIFDNWI